MKKYLLVAVSLFVSISVTACPVSVAKDIDEAPESFEGVVIGVKLTGYEEFLTEKFKKNRFTTQEFPIRVSSSTDIHKLDVFVTKSIKGHVKVGKVITVEAGGCGAQRPKLNGSGVFYYFQERNFVIPMYDKSL